MKKSIFSDGLIYLAVNVLNAMVPFLLLPILTRILSPEEYGLVTMFALLVTIFGAFVGLSVHGAVGVKFFQMTEVELASYISGALIILLSSCLIVVLIVSIIDWVTGWVSQFTLLSLPWVVLACLTAMCQFLVNIRLILWQVKRQAIRYGIFKLSLTVLNFSISLFLLFYISDSWESRGYGIFLSTLVFSILGLLMLYKEKFLSGHIQGAYVLDALRFGLPLIPHAVAAFIISMSDRFIVGNFLGEENLGIYMVALQLSMVMAVMADAFVKAYGPWIYKLLSKESYGDKLLVTGATYLVILLFAVSIFPVYLTIEFLAYYIVGDDFIGAVDYILWFVVGNAFLGMYYSIAGFYFYYSRNGLLSIVTLVSSVFSVVITVYMVMNFGLEGGAISFAIVNFVLFISSWLVSNFVVHLPWKELKASYRSIKGVIYAA